jgi:hypothetical protein
VAKIWAVHLHHSAFDVDDSADYSSLIALFRPLLCPRSSAAFSSVFVHVLSVSYILLQQAESWSSSWRLGSDSVALDSKRRRYSCSGLLGLE